MRGYSAIGLDHPKNPINVGAALRAAGNYPHHWLTKLKKKVWLIAFTWPDRKRRRQLRIYYRVPIVLFYRVSLLVQEKWKEYRWY